MYARARVVYPFAYTSKSRRNACSPTEVSKKQFKYTVHGRREAVRHHKNNRMPPAGPYCLVQVFASDKQVEPVSDTCNVPLPVESATPWVIHGVRVGYYRPASILKTLPGLHDLEESHLQGKRIRQLDSGKFVLSDVAAAVLFENPKNASQWANYDKHRSIAPSLTYIESGNINVSLLIVDLILKIHQFVPGISRQSIY